MFPPRNPSWYPVPRFKRPLEVWQRYKDQFGFQGYTDSEPALAERLKALLEKKRELVKRYNESKDPNERNGIVQQKEDVEKDIEMAGFVPKGLPAAELRKAFIEDAVEALVYAMESDSTDAFPNFQCGRATIAEDLERILREIGPEAAPTLWRTLSEQVRFQTADGQRRKAEMEAHIAELRARMQQLQDEAPKEADPGKRRKMNAQRRALEAHVYDDEQACKIVGRAIIKANQKVIDKLEELVAAIGFEAFPVLIRGAGESHPGSAEVAGRLIEKMGGRAVPKLIAALREETTFRAAARVLKRMSNQDFGDDANAWAQWHAEAAKAK